MAIVQLDLSGEHNRALVLLHWVKRKTGDIEVRQRSMQRLQKRLLTAKVSMPRFFLVAVDDDTVSRIDSQLLNYHTEAVQVVYRHESTFQG